MKTVTVQYFFGPTASVVDTYVARVVKQVNLTWHWLATWRENTSSEREREREERAHTKTYFKHMFYLRT